MKLVNLALSILTLLSALAIASPLAASVQEVDGYDLLLRSKAAMQRAQSMRASAVLTADTRSERGRMLFELAFWGEAQGLDRQRYFQDPGGPGATPIEHLRVGRESWARLSAVEEWQRLESAPDGLFTPFLYGEGLPDFTEYLLEHRTLDEGTSYRVEGTLDAGRIMAEQPGSLTSFGVSFNWTPEALSSTATAVWVIEKSTLHMLSVEMDWAAEYAAGLEAASVVVHYSDFNDPSIRVDAPVPSTARPPAPVPPSTASGSRPPPGAEPDLSGIRVPGAPEAPTSYIQGLASGNADLVWDAYSDRARRDLERRGVSREDTQRQLDQSRSGGNTILRAHYAGAHAIPNGSMHFYVIVRAGRDGDETYVPYVFTLDATGKIERID